MRHLFTKYRTSGLVAFLFRIVQIHFLRSASNAFLFWFALRYRLFSSVTYNWKQLILVQSRRMYTRNIYRNWMPSVVYIKYVLLLILLFTYTTFLKFELSGFFQTRCDTTSRFLRLELKLLQDKRQPRPTLNLTLYLFYDAAFSPLFATWIRCCVVWSLPMPIKNSRPDFFK